MLKKTYKFAMSRGKETKRVLKAVGWAALKSISKLTRFKVPHELSMTNFAMLFGVWDKSVSTVLKKVLKKGSVFVDVGAHVGYFTKEAAKIVGEEGKVYAFDANVENFEILVHNTAKYPQVEPIHLAVSNIGGTVAFYNSPTSSGWHSIVSERDNKSVITEIRAVTLDDALAGVSVDLVKIDVEGAEMAVIQGMKNIIERSKELHLVFEFFPDLFTRQGMQPHELLEMLMHQGFKVYYLKDHKHYFPITDAPSFTANLKEKYVNIYAVKGK